MSSSKRQSVLTKPPSGPKAPVNLSSSVVISDAASLTGNHTINISSESVVHPRCKLDSSSGRITIGRRCVVHERTAIGGPPPPPGQANTNEFGVLMEDYVTVEIGAVVESGCTVVREGCLIGVAAKVGKGAKLGKHCTITAKSVVEPGEEIPDNTVIFSNGTRRVDSRGVTELKYKAQARQIEVLRRLIPSNPGRFK